MTSNSVTFYAVFSACSTKKIACEYNQFLVETLQSNDFRNKSPVRTKLKKSLFLVESIMSLVFGFGTTIYLRSHFKFFSNGDSDPG